MNKEEIYFITGNKGKFEEIKALFPEIKQIDIDIPEIQEIDIRKIIEEKINELRKKTSKDFFCEDSALYINSLNGLPGPLIKWFLKTIDLNGIIKILNNFEDKSAIAKTIIGYSRGKDISFFEGILKGKIVEPRGDKNFGWDSIFQPEGFDKTLGEMSLEEKNKLSMRKEALLKLKNYIENGAS